MKLVLSNARFILEKCVGCKTCTHVCPTKAYTPSLNRPLDKKKIAPCAAQCPIGNDIEGFVSLIGQQKYLEAYALLLETNPLPGTTGRVCHHPCEPSCNRVKFDGEVSIQPLERFVADYALQKGLSTGQAEGHPEGDRCRHRVRAGRSLLCLPPGPVRLPGNRFRSGKAARRNAPLRHPRLQASRSGAGLGDREYLFPQCQDPDRSEVGEESEVRGSQRV